jgi:hypothetical protein
MWLPPPQRPAGVGDDAVLLLQARERELQVGAPLREAGKRDVLAWVHQTPAGRRRF